jgi:hypothetical protein
VEDDFLAEARSSLRRGAKMSGYAIFQMLRWKYRYKLGTDYGPILARLVAAKYPELNSVFTFKKPWWGKRRKKYNG